MVSFAFGRSGGVTLLLTGVLNRRSGFLGGFWAVLDSFWTVFRQFLGRKKPSKKPKTPKIRVFKKYVFVVGVAR